MVVRFITRRYIGEYDPTLEKVYAFHTVIDNEMVYFDILDTAGHTDVWSVFRDVCRFWRVHSKNPIKLKRSSSDREQVSPDTVRLLCSAAVSPGSLLPSSCRTGLLNRRWTEVELEEEDETDTSKDSTSSSPSDAPFRERASTDGHLLQKPWRWRYPPPNIGHQVYYPTARADRRMSISMRGSNASY
ncbi:ras-like family member 11 [Holotrichia oblita]|uniref:Ras-like family member 11 n=2 Tax=Holotrichia oblita TaxID=644536 RepID=A0ACB9SZA1_HOLOL|nr:ras-like family member 11 [Holotrichia oblita]KAI4459923.1 ras-like family member 11 [Holotrichia oblita]